MILLKEKFQYKRINSTHLLLEFYEIIKILLTKSETITEMHAGVEQIMDLRARLEHVVKSFCSFKIKLIGALDVHMLKGYKLFSIINRLPRTEPSG